MREAERQFLSDGALALNNLVEASRRDLHENLCSTVQPFNVQRSKKNRTVQRFEVIGQNRAHVIVRSCANTIILVF
jgi:hypothetical protein